MFSEQVTGSIFTVYIPWKRNTPLEYTIFKHMLNIRESPLIVCSDTFALFMRYSITCHYRASPDERNGFTFNLTNEIDVLKPNLVDLFADENSRQEFLYAEVPLLYFIGITFLRRSVPKGSLESEFT